MTSQPTLTKAGSGPGDSGGRHGEESGEGESDAGEGTAKELGEAAEASQADLTAR